MSSLAFVPASLSNCVQLEAVMKKRVRRAHKVTALAHGSGGRFVGAVE